MGIEKIDPNPDWQPGDIALCVRGGPVEPVNPKYKGEFPSAGRPYTVESVKIHEFYNGTPKPKLELGLQLKDGPPNRFGDRIWAAHRFIKVTPPEDMTEDTEEREKETSL